MKKKEPEPTLDQMTLRDLMAMFALMGLTMMSPEGAAKAAYLLADAMIEERKPKMKSKDKTPIRKGMDAPGMY